MFQTTNQISQHQIPINPPFLPQKTWLRRQSGTSCSSASCSVSTTLFAALEAPGEAPGEEALGEALTPWENSWENRKIMESPQNSWKIMENSWKIMGKSWVYSWEHLTVKR